MCVIIVKPANVAMPPLSILTACNLANPDGCGFVSPAAAYKGLDFGTFARKIYNVPAADPCVMHFRWATNGSVKRANCHPFKRGDVYFAHNGILDIEARGDRTDSQTAFDDIIYPAIVRDGYGSKGMKRAIFSIIGYSKFALLKGRDLRLFGHFIHNTDGCYYSNLNFARYLDFDGHVALHEPCQRWAV